jgi:hypothetical protein
MPHIIAVLNVPQAIGWPCPKMVGAGLLVGIGRWYRRPKLVFAVRFHQIIIAENMACGRQPHIALAVILQVKGRFWHII